MTTKTEYDRLMALDAKVIAAYKKRKVLPALYDETLSLMPIAIALLRAQHEAMEEAMEEAKGALENKNKALLLAARWFRLILKDEARYEHPPGEADLAGMFDAMQEARLDNIAISKLKEFV